MAPEHEKRVYLVGAGSGCVDYLTLKAVRILESAECVLYDALMDEACLDFVAGSCEKIFVGKRMGRHHANQDAINEQLYECAQRYERVVRLKGGSPTVFGRGFEEVRYLKERGVACEIVPGVSAAHAVPEMFGIPLVDRRNNDAFRVVTGHHESTLESILTPYHPRENLVILMGANNARKIVDLLLREKAYPSHLPMAFLCRGGMEGSERIDLTLGEAQQKDDDFFEAVSAKTPVIIFVGQTAALSCELDL